jgi:hypothetical protein
MTSPDGAIRHQVSTERGLLTPSMADDGTILAVDYLRRALVRRTPLGAPVGSPVATSTTNTVGSDVRFDAPDLASISPDGIHEAYGHALHHSRYEPDCDCVIYGDDVTARWGLTDHFEQPGQIVGTLGYTDPSWIDDNMLLLTRSAGESEGAQVATESLGAPDNGQVAWFSDPMSDQPIPQPSVDTLANGAMNRTHTRLAFVASVSFSGDGSNSIRNQIRIFRMHGDAPAVPTLQCALTRPAGAFRRPTWSPDGASLAWHEDDGIHVAAIGDATDCDALARPLIVPDGYEPYWGAASLPAGAPPTPWPAAPAGAPHPAPAVQGAKRCTVPHLEGRTVARARTLIARAGCVLRVRRHAHARRLVVARQSPHAGTVVPARGSVTVSLRAARKQGR